MCVSLPGRIFGSEVRPRKFKYVVVDGEQHLDLAPSICPPTPHHSPDYVKAVCEEAAQRREMLSGKMVTQMMVCCVALTCCITVLVQHIAVRVTGSSHRHQR